MPIQIMYSMTFSFVLLLAISNSPWVQMANSV